MERNDQLAQLLCGIMVVLDNKLLSEEQMATLFHHVPNLNAWWVEHKRLDAERKRQEAKAKKLRGIERKIAQYRRKLENE